MSCVQREVFVLASVKNVMKLYCLFVFLLLHGSLSASSVVPCADHPFVQLDKTTGVKIVGYPGFSMPGRSAAFKVFSGRKYLYAIEETYVGDFYSSLIYTDPSGEKLIAVGYDHVAIYDHGVLKSSINYRDFVKEKIAYDSLIIEVYANYLYPSCSIDKNLNKANGYKLIMKPAVKDIYKAGDSLYVRVTRDKYAHINMRTGSYRLAAGGVWHTEANVTNTTRLYKNAFRTSGGWVVVNKKTVRLDQFVSERLKMKLSPEDSDSSRQKVFISILTTNKGYTVFPGSSITYVMCLREKYQPMDSVDEAYCKKLSEQLFQKEFKLLSIHRYYELDYQWQDVEIYMDDKCFRMR